MGDPEDKIEIVTDDVSKLEKPQDGIASTKIEVPGEAITKLEISPKGKYLVTYSKSDNSIVGWNIEDDGSLNSEPFGKSELDGKLRQICVSDNKKLVLINNSDKIKIYDMMNKSQIVLDCYHERNHVKYSTFNLDNELILCVEFDLTGKDNKDDYYIFIYSTETKNNKWKCKRMYKIPKDLNLISISKYNKLYLFSNSLIYEHNLITEQSTKIYDSDEKIYDYKMDIIIFSNEKFICIRIENKIIIFSNELEIPVVSLDISDIKLYYIMYRADLIPLLLPLLSNSNIWNHIMEQYWKENRAKEKDKSSEEYPIESFPENIRTTTKYAFGILDGNIFEIKLEEFFTKMNKTLENSDKVVENWYFDDDFNKESYKTYDHLKDTILLTLFQNAKKDINKKENEKKSSQYLIVWKNGTLQVRKKKDSNEANDDEKWELICERVERSVNAESIGIELINDSDDSDIIILTTRGLFIYHFNENNKFISLNYYYYMEINHSNLVNCEKNFSTPTLPLPNYDSFKNCDGWVSSVIESKENFSKYGGELLAYEIKERNVELIKEIYNKYIKDNKKNFSKYGDELLDFGIREHNVELIKDIYNNNIKDNKKILLKYGVKLLEFVIKEHNIEYIEIIVDIYEKSIKYFEDDPRINKMFLSIITSTMPLLNKFYPEYISKYSSDIIMIIDSSINNIVGYRDSNLHLRSFQYPSIVNLTRSILWLKYTIFMFKLKNNHKKMYRMLNFIQHLIIFLTLPIYFVTFYILSKHHFIYDFKIILPVYYKIINIFKDISTTTPTITFMNPYIKFVSYTQDYNFFFELVRPRSSPFVGTISGDIYNTWNGETIIDFKWNKFGKYYYTIIWIGYMVLLGCFTAAATIPQQYLDDNIRNKLLITSIIFGSIYLSFEIRQVIYNSIKWASDFWNYFDLTAFLLSIFTSIYLLKTNDRNIQLLSFSCLFLDIKFLLFFRVFESFGVYFAIIISVGKEVFSFLMVLFIIIISFAHTFYILLSPGSHVSFDEYANNNDPNNPWNIATTYRQVVNGTINPDSFMIQVPDENTNMFIDFGTSIFAMYKFLTGDSDALSNWVYKKDPSLVILTIAFSFLIVVYLMNLFIGLLSNAIEKDNNRVSYLIQKAEILVEIELFYLLPHQRRWNSWFPEVIYYYADFDKTRQKIKEMIDEKKWDADEFPELKQVLLNLLKIQHSSRNPVDEATMRKILEEVSQKQANKLAVNFM